LLGQQLYFIFEVKLLSKRQQFENRVLEEEFIVKIQLDETPSQIAPHKMYLLEAKLGAL
jgi:hypothetical protein